MQEVATGKYHGHSFGGLNWPIRLIGPSYRCHYNLYFVAMPLVSYWHKADINGRQSDIGRHDQLPQAGASMKRRAFLWILGWAVPHNMTTPTTIIGQATIAALSIRRTY